MTRSGRAYQRTNGGEEGREVSDADVTHGRPGFPFPVKKQREVTAGERKHRRRREE